MKRNPTPLELALLGLAHLEPRSGYDFRKVFATTPLGIYSDSPGSIYPALRRLEQGDLLAGTVEREQSLRPRKVFRVTERGVEALLTWVTRPVEVDDVLRNERELMLRFAFLGDLVSREESLRFLDQLVTATDAAVEQLEQHLEEVPSQARHGRLALEAGIEGHRARAAWARRAAATIRRSPPATGATPRPRKARGARG